MKQNLILLYLLYLRLLARLQLLKNPHAKIIGITGSSGKTTTKKAVAHVLKSQYKVKECYKANSQTGIPLDILGLHMTDFSTKDWLRVTVMAPIKLLTNWERFDYYVVEMGIDGPDEPVNMKYLLKIIKPDIGIFLNATSSHAEPWDKLVPKSAPNREQEIIKLIAREKGRILTDLDTTAVAIANLDDPNISRLWREIAAKLITFGKLTKSGDSNTTSDPNKSPNISFEAVKSDLNGFEATFIYQDQQVKLNIQNQLFSEVYAYNFAAAIATALTTSIKFSQAVETLSSFRGDPGRLQLIDGINNSKLIDCSYNSQPNSLSSNLSLVNQLHCKGRKILVLGDMRELGESAEYWHRYLARQATFADFIILVGPAMQKFFLTELETLSYPTNQVKHFSNTYEAAVFTKEQIKADDLIFIQASQNTLLFEIIVEQLMAHPEDSEKLLCRRGEFWDQRREATKNR